MMPVAATPASLALWDFWDTFRAGCPLVFPGAPGGSKLLGEKVRSEKVGSHALPRKEASVDIWPRTRNTAETAQTPTQKKHLQLQEDPSWLLGNSIVDTQLCSKTFTAPPLK